MQTFNDLIPIFMRFLNDALAFLQGLIVIIFTLLIIYYKMREAIADHQSDELYAHKTKKILVCLVATFLARPIVSLLAHYFKIN